VGLNGLFCVDVPLRNYSLTHSLSVQTNYSDMLNRVEPLKNELKALEVEANENRRKNDEMLSVIAGLERSIARYKEEYAVLISQAQAIKADLAAVETKVSIFVVECGL